MTEQLIDPPSPDTNEERWTGGAKRLATVMLFLSLAVITVTPTIDALNPVEDPKLLGEEARVAALARKSRSVFDGSWMRAIEGKLRLRSRVRDTIAPYWSALLLRYLHDAPDDVIVGRDGWLFLRSRVDQPQSVTQRAPSATAAFASAMQRRMAVNGSRLVFAPIPRKAAACAELLPKGLPQIPNFDKNIYHAFDRLGVERIDVLGLFDGLELRQRYLPYDTHWTREAVLAFVDEVARVYPELLTNEVEADVTWIDREESTGLLGFAAIPPKHEARHVLDIGTVRTWRIEPHQLRKLQRQKTTDVGLAMVGSSFTDHFGVADAMAWKFQRPVYDGGRAASRFGDPLGGMLQSFHGKPLAPFVVYEFPIHQCFEIGRNAQWAAPTVGAVFRHLHSNRTTALPADAIGDTLSRPRTKAKGGWVRSIYRGGTMLSTGDGVMQLVIEVDAKAQNKWQVRTPEAQLTFTLPKGKSTVAMPVFDRGHPKSFTALAAMNPGAADATFTMTPSVDADLERATELTGTLEKNTWTLTASDLEIARHDVAIVQWQGRSPRLSIRCRGRDAAGEEVVVERAFFGARSKVAVMGLTPLAGCRLESVTLEWKGGPGIEAPTVSVAPLAVN